MTQHTDRLEPVYSAAQLMSTVLREPRWALPGLIPEGVSLLAGPPKLGKSFFVLGLALEIARGGAVFGTIPVEQGAVLYAALEDTEHRIQRRLEGMLNGSPAPENLYITHHLGQGADMTELLEEWLGDREDPRLIVIDVLSKVTTVTRNNEYSHLASRLQDH